MERRYQIGDLFVKNGVKGVVIKVDWNGNHGVIISLNEQHCNWHRGVQWCNNLGYGWKIPSLEDLELLKDKYYFELIQKNLTKYGTPINIGNNSSLGNLYWTTDLESKFDGHEFMYVFCFGYGKFSGISSDYKEAEYEYVRAVYCF